MESRLSLASISDLLLSREFLSRRLQAVPFLPHISLTCSSSFKCTLRSKVLPTPSVSCSNALSEQVTESITSDSRQDLQSTNSPSSSSKLVLVVGGTGGVGQLVVASLLDRNIKSRLLLRNPEKATTLFGEQDDEKLQVCQGDTRDPESLDPSIFEGVTHVICCTGTTAFPSKRWNGDNTPERVGQIVTSKF